MQDTATTDLTPQQQRRQARIEAILDAAMRIVIDEGPRGLAMRELATELQLSPGAVYRYFDGKDAIIAALAHRTLARYARSLDDIEEAARREARGLPDGVGALLVLIRRVHGYWALSVADPGAWRLINLFLVNPRRLITGAAHDRFMASVSMQIQRLAALTESCVASGALGAGHGVERALVLIAALNGSLQYLKMAASSPVPFSPEDTLKAAVDACLRGWGANDATLAAAWAHLQQDLASCA